MNDPRKAIRAALMIARRPAAYGGFQDGFGGGVFPTEHAMMSNLVPVMHPDGPLNIPEDEFNEQLEAQQEGRPNILTGGGTFARGGEVERRVMDPRDLPGIHVKTRHTFAAGGPVEEEEGFDAYHGSPYAFERFDSSKIGAGEGNQAFGYGHYLAEAEPVARGYRNSVSRQKGNVNLLDKSGAVIPVTEYAKPHLDSFFQSFGSDLRKSDIDHQISLLRTNWIPGQEKSANEYADAAETATDPGSREFFLNELEKIRKTKQGYVDLADALEKTHRVEPVGHMYHVRVKANPEHFLDWHAPLSEQHPEVRKKLATLGFTYDDAKASVADDALLAALFDKGPQQLPQHPPNPTGEDIHYNLMRGSNKAAAAAKLREAGIPGIKYFDAGSRSEGQGTRNYVIFDPDMIEVKRRYAEGGEVPSSKSLFTQDVYHGTSDNFPAFRDQPGGYSMPRALGVHVARDPVISSNPYFVERNIDGKGGNVMPLKTFSDDRFYEVHQPLHSYLPEGTEKAPGTVRTDDVAVENEIMSHAFKRDKGLLKRTLMQQRNLPEDEAHEATEKLHAGQPWEHLGQPVKDIDHLVRNYGLRPWSEEDRAWAVNSFRDALRQRGYVGVKYINTSPGETEGAKDPTCYIVFPKKGQEGVYPLRGRFAKYDPARAHEPDLMSARGGAVQRADGGNVPPRDFSDDGNVQQALSLSKRVTEGRIPQLQDAADLVAAGRMAPEEYHALVGTHKPVRPYTEVPRMATTEDLFYGLSSDKHAKIGAEKNIPEGHPVGLRLDIPAYQNKNVWAPTIHEGHSHDSKAIAHAPFAHIDSPTFSVHEDKALGVARGRAKAPFAKINGFWKPTSAEDAQAMAQEYLNHPEWRQVGMDPERHSFFYDRENRQPIVSADEALQVGPLVLAKNPKYGDIRDFKYASGGTVDDDPTVQQALDLTRQAQPQQEPVASAMQVAQSVVAPGRRRFEIAPARGFTAAPITKNEPTLTEPGSVSIKSLASAFKRAIDNHLALSPAEQIANARQAENNVAKFVGRGQTGKINSVLTANKKLMKAQTAGEDDTPLTLPDGRTVETIGLSLMPDYREGQFRVCGNSDACRDLCLGKESGQYRYDPTATQAEIPTTKEQLEQAKNKPRMAALRRTAAMLRDPESFAVYLHELIDGAKIMAERRGSHLGVRLNVLSDLHPSIMEPIIKAHPTVSFYDYTKMNYDPVAPNHHYTYSSTGLHQPERDAENPFTNWHKMRERLDQGDNVAMAFAHGKSDAFPEYVHDAETGKRYRVVSGDEHDFRPLDMVPEGQPGVIVALKNMAASNSEYKYENAARNSNGFFVHHEPDFEKTEKGTFAKDQNDNRIPRNKVYTVQPQPKKRSDVKPKKED